MYEAITRERSVFLINQNYVDSFKRLADQLQPYYTLNLSGAISNVDVWTAAFNIWLMSFPDEMEVLESVEKTFYYSCNFIVYEHLKNDYSFNYVRNHVERSNELSFLLSIHLTNHLNMYWYDLMVNNNLEDIIDKNLKRNYFDSCNESDIDIIKFMNDHARFVKVLVHDIKVNNTFSKIIKECCGKAFRDYEQLAQQDKLTLQI